MTAVERQILALRRRLLARPPAAGRTVGLSPEDEADVAISRAARWSRHSDDWVGDRLRELRGRAGLRSERRPLRRLAGWCIDRRTGDITHRGGRFFTILGVTARHRLPEGELRWDQPIIDQPEIGILGILAGRFEGILHVCLNAKREPGTVGGVQLSPTVQATYSNYTASHGGRRPLLVDLFLDPPPDRLIYARLQTEEGARFLYKSNRNLIVRCDPAELPELPDRFLWLTLRQVADLLRHDNVVNACTRSVLSALL